MNETSIAPIPTWQVPMILVLASCLLLCITIVIVLFGQRVGLFCQYLGLAAYVKCCRRSANYQKVVMDRLEILKPRLDLDEDSFGPL